MRDVTRLTFPHPVPPEPTRAGSVNQYWVRVLADAEATAAATGFTVDQVLAAAAIHAVRQIE